MNTTCNRRNLARTIGLAIILMLLGSTVVTAQRNRPSLDERMKILKEQLSLTDDQIVKIRKIHEEAEAKREKLFDSNRDDRTQMREEMMKLRNETDEKIERVLTAEQKEKFRAHKDDRPRRRDGSGMKGKDEMKKN